MSVMSPASMATSVPVPMAMPTSACGERRGVVDAVADHGDRRPSGLQPPDLVGLVLGQHLGEHPVRMPTCLAMASAVRRLSPVSMTTLEAEPLQRGDGRCGVVLQRVGDGDDAGRLAVDGHRT